MRGDPTLANWLFAQGAEHHGWDGDGTKAGGTVRLWACETELTDPPAGIETISKALFDEKITDREQNKPVSPASEPSARELALAALDEATTLAGIKAALRPLLER
jgi:hypothetical protein